MIHVRSISAVSAISRCALLFSGALAGCRAPESAPPVVKPSGFLGDYSRFRAGEKGEAKMVFMEPGAQLDRYDSVLLDSVTFWVTDLGAAKRLDADTRQRLSDHLYRAAFDRLAKDYRMVARPGPTTMRVRLAITDARDAHVVLNTITSTLPPLRMLARLGGLDPDTAERVGSASAECEVVDSESGRRLIAAIDERMGNATPKPDWTKWGDVDDALDFWANRLGDRLAKLRKGDLSPIEDG